MSYIGNAVPSVTSLGGDLDVNGHQIKSTSNGNIQIVPDGSGTVTIDQLVFPTGTGSPNQVLQTDGSGNLSFVAQSGGGGSQNLFSTIAVSGQSDVVADATTDTLTLVGAGDLSITTNAGSDTITFTATTEVSTDTSPILGGNLDVSTYDIVSTSNNNIDILPNGTGKVNIDGNGSTGGVVVSDGLIEIKTGTGNVAELRLYCENTSSPHYLALKAPAHASGWSGNYSLTLPTTDGNSGEYLKTDGSGVLSWDTPSGGGGGGNPSGTQLTITSAAAPTYPSSGNAFIHATQTSGDTGIQVWASGGPFSNSEVFRVRSGNNTTNLFKVNNQGNCTMAGGLTASYFESGSYICSPSSSNDALRIAGNVLLKGTSKDVRWYEGSNYVGFQGPAALSADQMWVLPSADGNANDFLQTDGSGNLTWAAASGGGGGGSFTGGAVANDIILGSLSNTSNHSNAVDIETVAEYDTIIGVGVGHAKQAGYFRNAWIYNSSNAATEPKYDEKIAIAFRNASGGAGGGADQAGFDFYSGSIQTYFRQAGYNYEMLCGAGGSSSVNNMRVSIYNASGSGGSGTYGSGSMIEFGLNHADAKYKFTDCWSYGNSYNYTFPRTAPSASGQVLVSDTNGDCTWQANSSDIRVKKNIEDNEMGLEFIEALRTVNFEFKSYNELHSTQPELTQYQPHSYEDLDEPPEEHKKGVQTGLVAQELEEVLISQGCEHFKGLFDDRFKVKQIDKEEFIMPLIKAVQELSQKVKDLEEKLGE